MDSFPKTQASVVTKEDNGHDHTGENDVCKGNNINGFPHWIAVVILLDRQYFVQLVDGMEYDGRVRR